MIAQQPLTNLQMELLELYAMRFSGDQLLKVKQVPAGHFAKRLTRRVDGLWQERGLTAADMDRWLSDAEQ